MQKSVSEYRRLRQYISDVRELETQRMILENTINDVDNRIKKLCIPKTITYERNPIDPSFDFSGFGSVLIILLPALFFGFLMLYASIISSFEFAATTIIMIISFAIAIYIIYDIIHTYRENKKLYEENVIIIRENYRINKEDEAERMCREKIRKERYNIQREYLISAYNNTCEVLERFYARNYIYHKYQYNIVAICMFDEYLQSGRCSTLIGHEGAYNLYENELRLGIIIEKMDQILTKLDEISNTQYAVYETLLDIQAQQERLSKNMDTIAKNQKTQIELSEATRYNTAVLKNNSNFALYYKL